MAVTFALMLPVLVGVAGLAIDVSLLLMRQSEMQGVADAAALAAASSLDGSLAGIERAIGRADSAAQANFHHATQPFSQGASWTGAALQLASMPAGGEWLRADSVTDPAQARVLRYARVDTAALADLPDDPGLVETVFMRAVGAGLANRVAPAAVAGPIANKVTPIGTCALSNARFGLRPGTAVGELVEFGYRRGIAYDLLQLNPSGPNPQAFLVNPVDEEAPARLSMSTLARAARPFVCSGTTALGRLGSGSQVYVAPLPGTGVESWLNARFGDYSGADACPGKAGAPPDANVKEFTDANPDSLQAGPFSPASEPVRVARVLMSVAQTGPAPGFDVNTGSYGPLWSASRPVRYVAGSPIGYDPTQPPFLPADWATLYPVSQGSPPSALPGYPEWADTPYSIQIERPAADPSSRATSRTMVLPLIDCLGGPVGPRATVLGFGRFFLTSKAQPGHLYAEFVGLATERTLVTTVALVR